MTDATPNALGRQRPRVSITFTRYAEPDWMVGEALDALAKQEGVDAEVFFLDQDWREDFARQVEDRSHDTVRFHCLPCQANGHSFARNMGLSQARTDLVLFMDPDVLADPQWAIELARAVSQPGVTVAGSRILPKWLGPAPLLSRSRVVLDQFSMLDWGEETRPAPRVVGAGMAINRAHPGGQLRFNESLGRRDGNLLSGDESDLCTRVRESGGLVVYAGRSVVLHQVPKDRLTWRWILRRLYFAGLGRAMLGGAPQPSRHPGFWDWLLLPIILPPYVAGWLRSFSRRLKRTLVDADT